MNKKSKYKIKNIKKIKKIKKRRNRIHCSKNY